MLFDLLIEPVWNRNCLAFRGVLERYDTFNRTSLESKLTISGKASRTAFTLLIEPVWNRNQFLSACQGLSRFLLIEPVWNRNAGSRQSQEITHSLLIEPVWNRNDDAQTIFTQGFRTFNRTSLESKLGYLVKFRYLDSKLLIEPVWNRNSQ